MTKQRTVRITDEVWEAFTAAAAQVGTDVSGLMRRATLAGIAEMMERPGGHFAVRFQLTHDPCPQKRGRKVSK